MARSSRTLRFGALAVRPTANDVLRQAFVEGLDVAAPVGALVRGALPDRVARVIDAGARAASAAHVLACPLRSGRGNVWGALLFHRDQAADRAWRRACAAFTLQAAATVDLARRWRSAERRWVAARHHSLHLAAQQDRHRRLAAEHLHGRVQARLFAVVRTLGDCANRIPSHPQEAAQLLAQARAELDEVREHDIRLASHELYPALVTMGLVPALQALADRWHPTMRVSLQAEPEAAALDGPLSGQPMPVRMAVYLAAEEALSNAARHGRATAARLRLAVEPPSSGSASGEVSPPHVARGNGAAWRSLRFVISVSDNGEAPARLRPGVGLGSVAARVEGLGGDLVVERQADGGVRLRASVPLRGMRPARPNADRSVRAGLFQTSRDRR